MNKLERKLSVLRNQLNCAVDVLDRTLKYWEDPKNLEVFSKGTLFSTLNTLIKDQKEQIRWLLSDIIGLEKELDRIKDHDFFEKFKENIKGLSFKELVNLRDMINDELFKEIE